MHLRLLALALMVLGCLHTLAFTVATANEPWINLVLSIDGKSYIRGMFSMVEQGATFDVDNLYHSPGFQIYLSFLWRLWPRPDSFFFFSKLVSMAMYIATVAMVVGLGSRLVEPRVGLCAGVLLSASPKFHVYVNLLQGEVLQAFLFTLIAVLSVLAVAAQRRRCLLILVVVSLLMAALILLQVRFLPILMLLPWFFPVCHTIGRKKVMATLLFPAVLVLALWSGYHSLKRAEFVMIGTGTAFRLKTAYNAKATGAAYPYPPPTEPSGLDFVLSQPVQVIQLVGRRFLYLWDLKPDEWYLGNPIICKWRGETIPTSYDRPLHAVALILFLAGAVAGLSRVRRAGSLGLWGIPYAILLSVLLGPLLVFASSRFLIPAIPMLVLFQALALLLSFELAANSLSSRRRRLPGKKLKSHQK